MNHQGHTYIHLSNALGSYLGYLRVAHTEAVKAARVNPCKATLERSKVCGDALQEFDDLLRVERQHVQADMGYSVAMDFVGRVVSMANDISEDSDRSLRR